MSLEVHRILSARSRRESRRPEAVSLGAALLLHTVIAVIVLLLPRLQPPPKPLEFVPVTVIPAQALGVRRPAPARRKPAERPAEKPAPEPAAPEPEPEPERPREEVVPPPPKPVDDDVPVLPKEDSKKPEPRPKPQPSTPAKPDPKPAASDRKPTTPPRETPPSPTPPAGGPAGVAPGETGDQVGRRGSSSGSALGTTAFGSRIGVDNPDFTYGYYLDRLLSLIDAQWQRPNMGEVRAVIHFEIARDGSISDLRVAETSGYNAFDFAALRAVQSAAPFPPLPRGYRNESLGVNLIVQ